MVLNASLVTFSTVPATGLVKQPHNFFLPVFHRIPVWQRILCLCSVSLKCAFIIIVLVPFTLYCKLLCKTTSPDTSGSWWAGRHSPRTVLGIGWVWVATILLDATIFLLLCIAMYFQMCAWQFATNSRRYLWEVNGRSSNEIFRLRAWFHSQFGDMHTIDGVKRITSCFQTLR